MKFEIKNRWTGSVQFTAEIECDEDDEHLSVKIGLSVKWAISSGESMSGADLSGANLSRADLSRADLSGADLSGASLSRADLSRADLSGADLSRADLSGASLSGANLSDAYLSRADLSGASLSRANLSRASLSRANLSRADLSRADLSGASLSGAKGSELAIAMTRILPAGALIGWKKLRGGAVAKLSIPAEARRSHAFGRKCRAEFVDVIDGVGVSAHDGKTEYKPGLRVTPDRWEEDWTLECAPGIHFFITEEEARAYEI